MADLPIVRPAEHLSAPLLVHLARRMQTAAEVELAAFGLRARHVIAQTLLRDLGEQNQSDLPATLGMDSTNVVALLNELEKDDLVQRRRSPEDRRRHTVSLTAAGKARLDEVEDLLAGVEQRVLDPLTPEEQRTFYALLARATSSPSCSEALDTSRACMEDGASGIG
ncbi:MAG TPA: MarR family winged helix-turn-helix transcriptional regulator [Mycobacterium sp.]|nr:MarR family winged helix-turn-helix transcriptional regulator [Mycobacterium sp.]